MRVIASVLLAVVSLVVASVVPDLDRPRVAHRPGEYVEYGGSRWIIAEVNTLHVLPKYVLENPETGHQTMVECNRVDPATY